MRRWHPLIGAFDDGDDGDAPAPAPEPAPAAPVPAAPAPPPRYVGMIWDEEAQAPVPPPPDPPPIAVHDVEPTAGRLARRAVAAVLRRLAKRLDPGT